jgi:hypothetical protein
MKIVIQDVTKHIWKLGSDPVIEFKVSLTDEQRGLLESKHYTNVGPVFVDALDRWVASGSLIVANYGMSEIAREDAEEVLAYESDENCS